MTSFIKSNHEINEINEINEFHEIYDIEKLVKKINILQSIYKIKSTLSSSNTKVVYLVSDKFDRLFIFKAKLKIFVNSNDVNIYKKLKNNNCQNLSQIISIYETKHFIVIISDYIDGYIFGDSHLIKYDSHLFQIFSGLINGLKYLNDLDIIHCDIKPDNVIVKIENNNLIPVIIDFDSSQFNYSCDRKYGTIGFMSPEIKRRLTSKSDIWSLGIMFYQHIFFNHIKDKLSNLSSSNPIYCIDESDLKLLSSYSGIHSKIVSCLSKILIDESYRISIDDLKKLIL